MNLAQANAYLDEHINLEKMLAGERATAPTLDRILELLDVLGDPHKQYPIVHVTGTNGKTSTSRAISGLLAAHDLSVGTYTSPHLVSVTERLLWNGTPISDADFAAVIRQLAGLESLLSARPTWFELVTAAGFAWFAEVAVDAAVVEVGLGGTWDATNAGDGTVAVITSIGLDHMEFLGDTPESVATEKAGIIKEGAVVVVGHVDEGPR
ncbi:MAG: Mur ligase family protein, partial [Acidimicrobiales bacterium]|nr:Mur ligase family protein [Acidimicrobiales bacterium]